MPERGEYPPEMMHEKKEYSFDEGVEKALARIQELLGSQDYVVVGIAGPLADDTNAGKTTLSGTIKARLTQSGIPNVKVDRFNQFDAYCKNALTLDQQDLANSKGVIIFGALTFGAHDNTEKHAKKMKEIQDREVQIIGEENDLPLSHMDIRILIYRPEYSEKESKHLLPDIKIKNEFAKAKI
ncbi:MAG: hypothetical protein KBD29_03510 [Candidatus Magasanikbacteria bacterium]|nr:hypothetical protein [Candidatus Magasanikbacteria bacterium]